jgi:hypothetical protein
MKEPRRAYKARMIINIEFQEDAEGELSPSNPETIEIVARSIKIDRASERNTKDVALNARIDHFEEHFTGAVVKIFTSLMLVEPAVLLEGDGYKRALLRENAVKATKEQFVREVRLRLPVGKKDSLKFYKSAHQFFFDCLQRLDKLEVQGNADPRQTDLASEMFRNNSNPAKELSSRFKKYKFSFDELLALRQWMKEQGKTLDEGTNFFDPDTIFSVLRKWLRQA